MISLTEKQMAILAFVQEFRIQNGYSPTVREIAREFRISARGSLDHLRAIEKKGHIRRTRNIERSIQLVEGVCPTCGRPHDAA